MSSNTASKSFSYTTSSTQPQSSIYGINVKSTGFSVDQGEQAERFKNLLLVRDLEEQERSRRINEVRDLELDIERFRLSARKEANLAQEEERLSRMSDVSGETSRRLLANKLSGTIAKDIQTPSLRLQSAASGLLTDAKILGHDLWAGLTSRASSFFGYQQQKAMELAHNLKGQAVEQAHVLSVKAGETAHNLKGQAQTLGEIALEKAQIIGEKAAVFGAHTLEAGLLYLTKANLTMMEEAEREWRMTSGLTIERFFNALKVSDIIKATALYAPDFEPNRWYATSILEEFERKRRFLVDKADGTSLQNAKALSRTIHLRNIQERSWRPQAKQIRQVDAVLAKKSSALSKQTSNAVHSPLGLAAM